TPLRPDVALDSRESSVSAIVRMPAGPLQQMGAGEHEIAGHLFVDAGDAAFPLPDVQRSDDGTWDVPIKLRANVFTPLPWGKIVGGIGAGLAGLAALGLIWTQRPVLPKSAQIDQYGTRFDIGGRKSASVGGPLDDVDIGLASTVGHVTGCWGRKASFTVDPGANDVTAMGTPLAPGQSIHLNDGDVISAGGPSFTYYDAQADGGADDGAGNL
ncbi:MAG TPA: hypothetical protein VFI22_14060, partial [Thermomicrobiales bacterium]|nr:hypothetical protein [Thermomicrobiales bacterium]